MPLALIKHNLAQINENLLMSLFPALQRKDSRKLRTLWSILASEKAVDELRYMKFPKSFTVVINIIKTKVVELKVTTLTSL